MNRHERRAEASRARQGRPIDLTDTKRYLPIFRAERLTAVELLAEGKTPEKVNELVDNAGAYAEKMIGEISTLAPPERGLACREGCSWCCYIRVGVSEAEVVRIVDYLRDELAAEDVEAIRERARAAAETARGLTADQHFAARIPCPLLQDNRCIAHEVRPLACRGYNSDEAEICRAAWEARDPNLAVRCYLPQLRTADVVSQGLAHGVRGAGLRSSALELSAALAIALDRQEAVDRWLEGHHPFATAVNAEAQAVRDASLAELVRRDR